MHGLYFDFRAFYGLNFIISGSIVFLNCIKFNRRNARGCTENVVKEAIHEER